MSGYIASMKSSEDTYCPAAAVISVVTLPCKRKAIVSRVFYLRLAFLARSWRWRLWSRRRFACCLARNGANVAFSFEALTKNSLVCRVGQRPMKHVTADTVRAPSTL